MATKRNGSLSKYLILHNGVKLKKGYHNSSVEIWSAGNIVTYHVDFGVSYEEEVDYGTTCLEPKTFTPAKDGWIFVGWSEDIDATVKTLTEKTMDSDPIELYAVYEQVVVKTFVSHNSSVDIPATRRYNAGGTLVSPAITSPAGAEYSGWEWRGWSSAGDTSASAEIAYWVGNSVTVENSSVHYGLYEQTITCTFYSCDTTKYEEGTRYYNASGDTINASVTVPDGAEMPEWRWRGYSAAGDTAGNAAVAYANGDTISNLEAGYLYYGLYERTVTVTSIVLGAKTPYENTRYVNAIANYVNPTFTIPNASITGAAFRGWSVTAGNTTVTYTNITDRELSVNTTVYAVYKYDDKTLKTGWAQYLYAYDEKTKTVLSGIDGTKYASLTANVQAIGLKCGAWAMACNAYVSLKTFSGSTVVGSVLLRNTYTRGAEYGKEDQVEQQETTGLPCSNGASAIVTLALNNATGQSLAVVYEVDVAEGDTYVTTVSATGRVAVG